MVNATIEDGGRYTLVLESEGCRTDPQGELVEISSMPSMEISASQVSYFVKELAMNYLFHLFLMLSMSGN